MRLLTTPAFLVLLAWILASPLSLSARSGNHSESGRGYLRLHPVNPRYFQNAATGRPVLLVGCGAIVPTARNYDYATSISALAARGIDYTRVWHFLPWEKDRAIWPWARSGEPNAAMGGAKFDMNLWNDEYWVRMRDALSRASAAGIASEILVFDRCGMAPPDPYRWGHNPWAADNNVNRLELPPAAAQGVPDFYVFASKPILQRFQARYVEKLIDETVAQNVIYEIENEHIGKSDPAFAIHYGNLIKNYIARRYPDHPRLVSYSSLEDDLEALFSSTAVDIVNKHFGPRAEAHPDILNAYIEPRWRFQKPINIDEFANGLGDEGTLRRMAWTIILSGGHFHVEDVQASAHPYRVIANIKDFLEQSGWDFVRARPGRHLVVDGFCMAQTGVEYVGYLPSGETECIDLAPGNYALRWWNPRDGGFGSTSEFKHPEGKKDLKKPDRQDWVFQIRLRDTLDRVDGR